MKSKTAVEPMTIGERTFKERLIRDFKMNGALYAGRNVMYPPRCLFSRVTKS